MNEMAGFLECHTPIHSTSRGSQPQLHQKLVNVAHLFSQSIARTNQLTIFLQCGPTTGCVHNQRIDRQIVLVDVLAIRYGTDSRPMTVTPDEWAATRGK